MSRAMRLALTALLALAACAHASAQFNIVQTAGSHLKDMRDDLMWSPQSAGLVYHRACNVALTSPTRYGLADRWELATTLAADYWLPNLAVKHQIWHDHDQLWYFSGRLGANCSTPGLRWAQNRDYDPDIVDSADVVGNVLGLYHELIVSRAFRGDGICTTFEPWLILTLSFQIAAGIDLGGTDIAEMQGHFVTNRGEVLAARGGYARLMLWADYKWTNRFIVHGGLCYYAGTFSGGHALEVPANIEMMLTRRISLSTGMLLSAADYDDLPHPCAVAPWLDLRFYLGYKKQKEHHLFQDGVMKRY